MSAIRQPLAARRGFTLVELLVGLALALLVVAGGGALLTSQIRDHRALVLEARLMQDLRTAADLVARDLRRAGYWGDAGAGVWSADAAPRDNPYAALAPDDAASDAASLRYSRDTAENHVVDGNEQFGFRLRNRAIEIQLGSGNWQALTDATLLAVTEF
ncbi:MAG TPA: prepilin-type N-terminal cleavage/methylation domain-containing protein, partial [Burkholderiaceae bacterium]|nr:prepilin-type N-terminal cleavage/methylation domain-containing protein [Burkholderiaceae bacterium]